MKTINTTWADFARGVILLGRQGENLTGRLHVDVSEMLAKYPGATFGLRAAVPGGEPYPVSHLKRDGAAVVWTITDADTAHAGEGWAQLVLYGDGQEIAKTEIAHTLVLPSLTCEGGTPPDAVADWLNRAEETLGRLEGLSILPPITAEDDGKVLTAVNGEWVPMEPTGGGGEGGGVDFEVDETLKLENGILGVNTAKKMEKDNTLPITSAAVYVEVGNINALLETI